LPTLFITSSKPPSPRCGAPGRLLDPPSRATRIARGISGGQKKFKKNPKKVLHLFSALDTSAGNPRKFEAKKGQKKVQKKSQKSLAFIFQS
jgi:hypothetical protein